MLTMIASAAGTVHAADATSVPEIDGSSATVALGILAGAVLIVRARMRAK
jgi:hypothetical protein